MGLLPHLFPWLQQQQQQTNTSSSSSSSMKSVQQQQQQQQSAALIDPFGYGVSLPAVSYTHLAYQAVKAAAMVVAGVGVGLVAEARLYWWQRGSASCGSSSSSSSRRRVGQQRASHYRCWLLQLFTRLLRALQLLNLT